MGTIYILIMLWNGGNSNPPTILSQEFNSYETCEVARKSIEKVHNGTYRVLISQGCFKK